MTQSRHLFRNKQLRTKIIQYLHRLKQHCENSIPKLLKLPPELNTKNLAILLRFLKTKPMQKGTHVSDYTSLEIYFQALKANPLISSHPKFRVYYCGAWWYFRLRTDPRLCNVPSTLIAEFSGITPSIIDSWRRGDSHPRILFILAERRRTLAKYQQLAAELFARCNDIRNISDLDRRIGSNHFFFNFALRDATKFENYRLDAIRFLSFLQLVEAGYHPIDVGNYFKCHGLERMLISKRRPYLLRIAARIPKEAPKRGFVWLPTIIDDSKLPSRFIEVPRKITHYKQLIPVLMQLNTLTNPDTYLNDKLEAFGPPSNLLRQWINQFGKIRKLKAKIRVFAYAFVGVALSDGCIPYYPKRARFSSHFQLALSCIYKWSQGFGDRVSYYFTCLGIPMKRGKKRRPSRNDPNGSFSWFSIKSPFLTWMNQAVLGFRTGELHSSTPAKINWVLKSPLFFQKAVIQGLFDGDGWAMPTSHEIGIQSEQNQRVILQLLQKVGIKARREGRRKVLISSKEAVEAAVKLPVFLASEGRQKRAEFLGALDRGERLTGNNPSLPLRRRVLDLHRRGRSINWIRVQVFAETGVTLSKSFISRTIRRGVEVLRVDMRVVRAYFELLQAWLSSDESKLQVVREVRKRTGCQRVSRCWLNSANVPQAVKLYLSDHPEIDRAVLDAFPHLVQYLPKSANY